MLFATKLLLLATAGLAYILAGVLRWRSLAHPKGADQRLPTVVLTLGLAFHAAATLLALIHTQNVELVFAACGSLFTALAILILARALRLPGPGLLVLPIGLLVLLIALAGHFDHSKGDLTTKAGGESRSALFYVHLVFMIGQLAASLLGAVAGMAYLVVSHQLKTASTRALRLPGLPILGMMMERTVVLTAGLLCGGVISGWVAISGSSSFSLLHPIPILSLILLVLSVLAACLRIFRRIGGRGMAWFLILVLGINATILIFMAVARPHG